MQQSNIIKVAATVKAGLDKVWDNFTNPSHVSGWNFATDDWHCPKTENDLQQGGKFSYRMEAKDGSMGFDFEGTYNFIVPFEKIEYTVADGRKVEVLFKKIDDNTTGVVEFFEPESTNPQELQKQGWQAILNQFKKYTESQ